MEYFLVHLAYTPAAWSETIENTSSPHERLTPARRRLRHLSGPLVSSGLFATRPSRSAATPPDVMIDKCVIGSGHDLLTTVAMRGKKAAHTSNMAVPTGAVPKIVDLTPTLPMQDAGKAMVAIKAAIARTGYVAPGQAKP